MPLASLVLHSSCGRLLVGVEKCRTSGVSTCINKEKELLWGGYDE